MTKMVNSLTAASEIGGPMAAMYLLKHPDHYTGHKFRPCYWRGFVLEVMRAWNDSKNISEEGRSTVVVALDEKSKSGQKRIVPLSPVLDYMWRPAEYEDICVYDWIRLNHKKSMSQSRRKQANPQLLVASPEDNSDFENDYTVDETVPHLHTGYETISCKTSEMIQRNPRYHTFMANHPQAYTHEVRLMDEIEGFVPNFIGGPLPRKDAGSHEEYCMTMLTLFKPWRSGKDLRPNEDTMWNEVFDTYGFTERQKQIMKFFHIKYECNDARDDYSAMRKQAGKGKDTPLYMGDQELDEIEMEGYIFDGEVAPGDRENELINATDWNSMSQGEILRQSRMQSAENVMKASGWLDPM
ncbi:hypothetical protein L226DRAFT_474272, partial [Lentinus tigrinus ALCF2SS1-7]|uniref:uncharacterized protein n=1 Tax=Lentinus tigrinus ALCF2SS1-7 TaxID=1328758 RepID=UPI0011662CD3